MSRPRVLVTGATGAVGRGTLRHLRHHADVVAMARNRLDHQPPGVEFVAADVRDAAAVRRAVKGCDAVVHLAWAVSVRLTDDEATATNVGGTTNLVEAASDAGVARFVFCSSVTAYGSDPNHAGRYHEDDELRPTPTFLYAAHKAQMEELVAGSGMEEVRVRLGTVLGRHVDNGPSHVFTGPVVAGIRGQDIALQFIHQDDVGRFFATVALDGPTGPVNLAADDAITTEQMADLVGRPMVSLPEPAALAMLRVMFRLGASEVDPEAMAALKHFPVVDTTRMREGFGFRPSMSSAETVVDMMRAGSRYVSIGPNVIDLPRRLPYAETEIAWEPPADGAPSRPLLPDGWAGQFDTPLDPRYPEYTSTNMSEAFPGPMTPLTLEVALNAMRASGKGIAEIFGFTGPIAAELIHRGPVSIGHRMYVNISATREMARTVPGMTPEDIDHQYLGRPLPAERPSMSLSEAATAVRLLVRGGPRISGLAAEAERSHEDADHLHRTDAQLAEMTDEQLVAHVGVVHDQLVQAWNVACIMNMVAGGAWGVVERVVGKETANRLRGNQDRLASARTLVGVRDLAERARADAAVADVLRSSSPGEALDRCRGTSPAWAAAFDDLLQRIGHRGPGETELANEVFVDRPDLLVEAIQKSLDAVARPAEAPVRVSAPKRALAAVADRQMRVREHARDAAMRLTHALRRAIRERGRRLAEAGVIANAADVVYLRLEEVRIPPPSARELVVERRDERARLSGRRPPGFVTFDWMPDGVQDDGAVTTLTGLPAAPGIARGRVRVLDHADGLEPGEILVTEVTDVGWTALFGYAAGVITDLGGSMSHAAVVAREFGVPAVVGTQTATHHLQDGQLVEIDGAAGTVVVLEDSGTDDRDTA